MELKGNPMGIRVGNTVRVGHRLPGGFYASVPVAATGRRPVSSYSRGEMNATTVVVTALAVFLAVFGLWPITMGLLAGMGYQWALWRAYRPNPAPWMARLAAKNAAKGRR